MLFKMALRNVFRHKRRTFITVFTMSIGLMFFIFFDSLFVGMDVMLTETLIKYTDSAITIYSLEYDKNKKALPINKNIKDFNYISNIAMNINQVESIAPRTQFIGEIIYFGKSKHIIGTIIDPVMDSKTFDIINSIPYGNYFSENNENEILIGSYLAKELGISVGDSITLSARTKYETYNAVDYVVKGLIKSPSPNINETGVFITYKGAERLLNLEGNITAVHIKVKWNKTENIPVFSKKVDNIKNILQEKLNDYKIYSFTDIVGDFLMLMKQKRVTSYLIIFLMLIISGVGIVNTILMAVYERIKEIGVLMAMGFKPKEIRKLFLLEGTIIGIIGGLLGIILGLLLDIWLIYSGYNIEKIFGSVSGTELGIPVWGTIYGVWNLSSYIICIIFALITAIISSYIPARYASKLQVTDCLRFV